MQHNDKRAKAKMKKYADDHRHVQNSDIKEGDGVLVKNRITAKRQDKEITRNVSYFKKLHTGEIHDNAYTGDGVNADKEDAYMSEEEDAYMSEEEDAYMSDRDKEDAYMGDDEEDAYMSDDEPIQEQNMQILNQPQRPRRNHRPPRYLNDDYVTRD